MLIYYHIMSVRLVFLAAARAFDQSQPPPDIVSLKGAGVIRAVSTISLSFTHIISCEQELVLSGIIP